MKYKILVVDDDKELVKMLCSYFNMKQYETITATDGMEALNKIEMKPDIILLDINMPRMDGIEVCRLIRSKVLCPILFLTARVDEDDKINGLLSGGDDYITKPFSLRELEARIVTNIKREERHQQKTEYRFMDEMLIDYSEKIVAIDGHRMEFTKIEYQIIEFLSMHPGHVETVVLLSRKTPDDTIEVDLNLDELDATSAETKATYEEIKKYVKEKYQLKVSNLYISQIKRKCGIEVGINYNLPKSENPKVPQCPPEKERAIRDALEHFQMVS